MDIPAEVLSLASGAGAGTLFVVSILTGLLTPKRTVDAMLALQATRVEQLTADLAEAKDVAAKATALNAELVPQLISATHQLDELLDALNRSSIAPVSPAVGGEGVTRYVRRDNRTTGPAS